MGNHNHAIDKAVILARGLGTRMRKAEAGVALDANQESVAASGTKALIPIGRPFLDYVLTALADAGYRRICLVIGPEHGAVRDYYGRQLALKRLTVDFAVQEKPKGTADAVAAAESFAAGDQFLVINSDNYYPLNALKAIREQSGPATALFDDESMLRLGNISSDRLAKFAVGVSDAEGCLERIMEKPDPEVLKQWERPLWLSMNCWRFGPSIFEACKTIAPSPRNEYELPDAVLYSIRSLGEKYRIVKIREAVLDMTSRADIASMKAALEKKTVDL